MVINKSLGCLFGGGGGELWDCCQVLNSPMKGIPYFFPTGKYVLSIDGMILKSGTTKTAMDIL